MFTDFFDNDEIRKYVVLFGNLFNDIHLMRTNPDSESYKQVVPIAYGGREKYVARNTQDPELDRSVAAQLPRMAYELVGLSYDPQRATDPLNKLVTVDGNTSTSRYQGTPWNFTFNLYITARHVLDASKIVQQILPFFRPSFTLKAQIVDDVCAKALPIVLDAVNMQDNYEGGFQERRVLIWTLTFTLKGYIYGPSEAVGGVIRWISTGYSADVVANTEFFETSNTYPTLANTALIDILPSDPYEIVTVIVQNE